MANFYFWDLGFQKVGGGASHFSFGEVVFNFKVFRWIIERPRSIPVAMGKENY